MAPIPLLVRMAKAFLERKALLSAVFTSLAIFAIVALTRAPHALVRTTEMESAGIVRLRDTHELLLAVVRRQFAPGDVADLAPRVARVIHPKHDGVDVDASYLDAVRLSWVSVSKRPHDQGALAALGTATAELASKISDAAHLTYDTDVDADNFGDASAYQLPKALENAAHAAALADRPHDELGVPDRLLIGRLMAQAEVGWVGADNDVDLGLAATAGDTTVLTRERKSMSAAFTALETRLDAVADSAAPSDVAALPAEERAFEAAAPRYVSTLDTFVGNLLQRRIAAQSERIDFIIECCIFALGGSLMLVGRVSHLMLERERRALQIERDRASALENELARQRAERARVLNEAQFRTIFDGSPLGIATLDRDGMPLERNTALLALPGEFALFDATFDRDTYARLLGGTIQPRQVEREFAAADGSSRWIDLTVFPVRVDDSESVAAIAMVADVTERRLLSEQLRYEAKHDALTGLRSRGAFLDEVRAALDERHAASRGHAIMLIDLDRFKLVNDSLGHAAGDDVLVAVAKRLSDIVRPTDVLGRLHGDEFALYLGTSGEAELSAIAERAQQILRAPFVFDGQPVFIDSSIGICIAQGDVRPEDMLRNADTAMYKAKRMGRGRFVYFNGAMKEASTRWMRLASDLLLGLERGEFHVAYQPIVALDDATIQGFEALVRWDHHELGAIAPIEFIPIAEETGAIVQLGRFVLAEACRQVARWDWEHRKSRPVTMSINLSAHQLEAYLVHDLEQCLAEAGISGDRLILEITESTLL
ncbi:MAG: diguanylate cyclase, partial [Candidatus Eremiobacteraeota bacterium]|nr:diguanylate cyclase [Candidatus Eremiobacteraeota bacterium]